MYHGSHVLKKPFVRTVSYPIDILVSFTGKVRLALGDDGADTSRLDGVENGPCHLVGVVQHDAAESDIDWWRTGFEKSSELKWWCELGRIANEETRDVYEMSISLGHQRRSSWACAENRPMWEGQSAGLGTKAGDQQYVNGILRVSANAGPSNIAISSRSMDFRHLLITSPSLSVVLELECSVPYGGVLLTLAMSSTRPQ